MPCFLLPSMLIFFYSAFIFLSRIKKSKKKGSIIMFKSVYGFCRNLLVSLGLLAAGFAGSSWAGEADLVVPDLSSVKFIGVDGHTLLLWGMLISTPLKCT